MELPRAKDITSPLYRNALLLIINSAVLSGFGFIFWAIIARFFPVREVGLATSMISLLELILVLSLAGFNVSLIRYLPGSSDRKKLVSSCFIISGSIALFAGALSVAGISIFSPELSEFLGLRAYALFFVLSAVSYTLFTLTDSVLIAHRDAIWVVLKSLLFSLLKLAFPFLLITLGAFGIFISVELSAFIALLIIWSLWSARSGIKPALEIDRSLIRKMIGFNTSNYIANILLYAPALIMPLIITTKIGPETAAYFYYPIMIYGLLSIIPSSIAQSLLAEGSHSAEKIGRKVRKSLLLSYVLLLPCVLIILFFGKHILLVFGSSYSENSYRFLQLLAIASLFSAANIIYISASNIRHKVGKVIMVTLLASAGILSISIMLMGFGLAGIGIAWIAGHLIANIAVSADLIASARTRRGAP